MYDQAGRDSGLQVGSAVQQSSGFANHDEYQCPDDGCARSGSEGVGGADQYADY